MPRHNQVGDPAKMEVNMTPLLDVVLQLITFFMMLVHFGVQIEAAEVEVRLPVAPAALPAGVIADDRLVVAVGPDGALLVDGKALLGPAAATWWASEARRREGSDTLEELPTRVIIRADREASYGAIRSVLATAQEQGFAFFTLVVLRSEN